MDGIPKVKSGFAAVGCFTVAEGENGTDTYGPIVRFKYGREYTAEPQGEPTELYGDSENLWTEEVNDGYLINLDMIKILDKFAQAWYGDAVDESTGTRDEYKNQIRPRFGLVLMDLTSDGEGELQFYFNCQASKRPSKSGKTREGKIEYQYERAEIKARPRYDGLVVHYAKGNELPETVPVVTKPTETPAKVSGK